MTDVDHFEGGKNITRGSRDGADLILSEMVKTAEGGDVFWMTNATGSATVKGTIVEASATVDDGFDVAGLDCDDPIGVVYDDGVPDGERCRIVHNGKAHVLVEASQAVTRTNWLRTSSSAVGRVHPAASPPGADPSHWQEVGHAVESVAGGANVLVLAAIHFN